MTVDTYYVSSFTNSLNFEIFIVHICKFKVNKFSKFQVTIGLHKTAPLSFLFNIVMDVLTENEKLSAPYMLCVDDIILMTETSNMLKMWKRSISDYG